MVRVRLKRTGTHGTPCFRVVVMDNRSSRDGKAIEELGYYNPKSKEEKLNLERVAYWRSVGASFSETAEAIIKRLEGGVVLKDKVRTPNMSKKAKAKIEAEAKAKADAEAKAKAEAEAAAKAAKEAEEAAKAAPAEEAPKAEEVKAE